MPADVSSVPVEEVPALLGHLEVLRAALWARLSAAPSAQIENHRRDADEKGSYLKPHEAAQIMGVGVRWLYRHHQQLPFARKLSRKVLRFSEPGLRRWLAVRR